MASKYRLVTFGEAMIRFAPIVENNSQKGPIPSAAAPFLRSVGGDELNVAVALRYLGRSAQWTSILPTGPLGNVVRDCATDAFVDISEMIYKDGEEVGTYFMLPAEKRVHYQRSNSAWAKYAHEIDWKTILDKPSSSTQPKWMHITGITPMTGPNALRCWRAAIEAAFSRNIPISMDLNHRKQLGTIKTLWDYTLPFVSKFKLLIMSVDSLKAVAELEGFKMPKNLNFADESEQEGWIELLAQLYEKLRGPRIACCFKTRNEDGLQRRWSVIYDQHGRHSTFSIPVYHTPKDECGGGSAWAAGYLDTMFEFGEDAPSVVAARRADLLAALCQEIIGDHSNITREELTKHEKQYEGKAAYVDLHIHNAVKLIDSDTRKMGTNESEAKIKDTMKRLKEAKVVAILRAKNAELAISRAEELVQLGCRALEVTMDSVNVMHVLTELCKRIPREKCLIGAGTVTSLDQLDALSKIQGSGIAFAISPITPDGMVERCKTYGMVAMPAASTPNEMWKAHSQGAHTVKLFPAKLWTPTILKEVLDVGPLGKMNVVPSGGVTPENATSWLESGAFAVAMGSQLVGKDIRATNKEDLAALQEQWNKEGRESARALFQKLYSS